MSKPQASKLFPLIQYGLYPATVGGGLLLGYYQLYIANMHLLSLAIPVLLGFFICATAERLMPYRPSWNITNDDVTTDLGYIGFNILLREGSTVLIKAGLLTLAAQLAWNPALDGFWPLGWHPLLQVIIAILTLDFFEYLFHRASHRISWLYGAFMRYITVRIGCIFLMPPAFIL